MARLAGVPADDPWDWAVLHALALRETKRILHGSHDAEDAAQEALVRAVRSRACCATPEAPGAWVRTIARREAYRLSSTRREKAETSLLQEDGRWEDESDLILDRLNAHRNMRLISADDRSLLLRRHVFGQTSSEIASDLGVPATTVRVRLHRAAQRVRARVTVDD